MCVCFDREKRCVTATLLAQGLKTMNKANRGVVEEEKEKEKRKRKKREKREEKEMQ